MSLISNNSSLKTKFSQGDFVDLILRDINNLVVTGVIESYNRGNMLERFVESFRNK